MRFWSLPLLIALMAASPAWASRIELVKPLDTFRATLLPGEAHRTIVPSRPRIDKHTLQERIRWEVAP